MAEEKISHEDHEIQLLSKELVTAEPIHRYLRWALGTGRVIIVVVEALVLLVFFARFKLDHEIVNLKLQMDFQLEQLALDRKFGEDFLATQSKLVQVQDLLKGLFLPGPILEKILENTPSQDLIFSRLKITPQTVTIEGTAASYWLISNFRERIHAQPELGQVELTSLWRDEPVESEGAQGPQSAAGPIRFVLEGKLTPTVIT